MSMYSVKYEELNHRRRQGGLSVTVGLQVFLSLPLHLYPATFTYLQADIQSSTLLHSRCPNLLYLSRLTTSATLCTPKRLQIHTALSILQRHSTHPSHHHPIHPLQAMQILSLHRPCFSPICQTHSGHKLCISFSLCGVMHHILPG